MVKSISPISGVAKSFFFDFRGVEIIFILISGVVQSFFLISGVVKSIFPDFRDGEIDFF